MHSPLARKPRLRVDIPRSAIGQAPPASDRHENRAHGETGGEHGANMRGFAHEPVRTPVTPVDERGSKALEEMFSDKSPAAVLGDQVARMRIEQGGGANVRRPPRPPHQQDHDEGSGEVVIDIPVDVSPYMEMFMRPAPPSQGRVLCRVDVKPQKNGNCVYEMCIEESNVLLLVALYRARQKDVLISMYEKEIETNHIGVLRSVQVRAAPRPPCARACGRLARSLARPAPSLSPHSPRPVLPPSRATRAVVSSCALRPPLRTPFAPRSPACSCWRGDSTGAPRHGNIAVSLTAHTRRGRCLS
jgi:hypothetical protein